MAEMVRVNTRISSTLNDWLDEESEKTGTPKSTLVMLALETYVQQRKVMDSMNDIGSLIETMNQGFQRIENQIKDAAVE